MPEIIGSAYVRIKAITDGLNSDIQKGLDKGASGIDMKSSGEKIGSDFGVGVSKGLETESSSIKEKVSGIGDGADDSGGMSFGQRWARKMYLGIEKAGDDQKAGSMFKGLAKNMGKLDDMLKVPRIALAGLFGSPAIGGAIKTLGSYIGALAGQLGYLSTAAVGAAAGIAGAFGLAALAVGPLMLAFKTESPALDLFKEKAKAFGDIWKGVGEATQNTLLPSLADAMQTTTQMVPVFEKFGAGIGFIAGGLAKFAAEMFTSSSNALPLQTILKSSTEIFHVLGTAAVVLGDILIKLFAAVAPIAKQFAETLFKMVGGWSDFITKSSQSGALTQTLQEWYDRAKLIGGALVDLSVGLWNMFKAGADAAEPFFKTLDNTARRFREFTESTAGKLKIQEAFENFTPIAQEVNGLMKDLIAWIVTPTLTGDSAGIIGFFQLIRTVVLPAIQDLTSQLSGALKGQLDGLVRSLASFIQQAASGQQLSTFFSVLSSILGILTKLVSIPGLDWFIGSMLAMGGAFKAINIVAKPLISVVGGLAGAFSKLAGKQAMEKVTQAFDDFQGSGGKGGIGGVQSAIGGAITSAFNPLTLAIGGITAAITIGFAVWEAWSTNVKRVADEAKAVTKAVRDGGDALDELAKDYQNVLDTRDSFQESFDKTGKTVKEMTELINAHTGDVDKLRTAYHENGEDLLVWAENAGGLSNVLDQVPKSMRPLVQEMYNMRVAGDLTANEFAEFLDGLDDTDQAAMAAEKAVDRAGLRLADLATKAGLSAGQLKLLSDAAEATNLDDKAAKVAAWEAQFPLLAAAGGKSMETIKQKAKEVADQFADVIAKLEELKGVPAEVGKANDAMVQSQNAMLESLAANGTALTGNSEAAMANRAAMDSMAESTHAAAEAQAKQDKSGKTSTATLLALRDSIQHMGEAAGISQEDINGLLDRAGVLSDTQIQAEVGVDTAAAITSIDELEKSLGNMDGVPQPVIAHLGVLVDQGKIDEAQIIVQNWKKQAAAEQIFIDLKANPEQAVAETYKLLGWVDDGKGTVTIDGHPVPAEEAAEAATAYANGKTGTITIDGNKDPATGKTTEVVAHVNAQTGEITIDADTTPAAEKLRNLKGMIEGINNIFDKTQGKISSIGEATGRLDAAYQTPRDAAGNPIPLTATTSAASYSTAALNRSMRSTISRGRASAAYLAGAGISNLRAGSARFAAPNLALSAYQTGTPDESSTVEVPGSASSADTPITHITVKIGERDITDIVDVQMDGRMSQLATALRRAG